MAININHSSNTFCSNSGTFIFGTGIIANGEDTVYSKNFSGKYYGDASALTGLATGSFITTGQTGAFGGAGVDLSTYITTGQTGAYAAAAGTGNFVTTAQTGVFALAANTGNFVTTAQTGVFITQPNDFINVGNNNSFVLGTNNSISGNSNFIQGSSNVVSGCDAVVFGGGHTIFDRANSNVILSSSATISGYACNNVILGGILHKICENTYHSVILGGVGTVASTSSTAYGVNFCAYGGKYYGDGSALTGLATGEFVATGQTGNFISLDKCQVVAKNSTPFNICAVTRVASAYIANNIGNAYLCDHDDASNDDCNLYTINSNGYCVAQFSAMILGNAVYGNDIFTTSMTINGVAGSGSVLSQNKIINSKAFPTDDACVVVQDGYLRIYITGTQTGMNWGTRLDILGMVGYD